MLTYTLTDTSITVLDRSTFEPYVMPSSHPAFEDVVAAVKAGDDAVVQRLMNLPAAIVTFAQGRIKLTDRVLYFNDRPLDTSCTRRIVQFMEQGDETLAKPLINFLEKVVENPSRRAVLGLYDWAERSGLPITPEGDIIAWKIVQEDYRDIHSGRFDNSVGNIVEIDRNEVDEDPDVTCSYGLHVCSTGYLPHYGTGPGSRVLVVKVHPKDFVAVPRDYNCAKARVCRYEVIGEMPRDKAEAYLRNRFVYEPKFTDIGRAGELEEDVEVGRYYLTRDGRTVQITNYDGHEEYPYTGELDGETHSWMYDGVYFQGTEEHDYDLIEALPEGFVPDEPAPKKSWFSKIFG